MEMSFIKLLEVCNNLESVSVVGYFLLLIDERLLSMSVVKLSMSLSFIVVGSRQSFVGDVRGWLSGSVVAKSFDLRCPALDISHGWATVTPHPLHKNLLPLSPSRGYKEMTSILHGWPIALSYMSPNAGEGRLRGLSQWVKMCSWSQNLQ